MAVIQPLTDQPLMRSVTLIDTIAFDADDTLWQNEKFFRISQASFAALLKNYTSGNNLERRLFEAEKRNLRTYGFGIKGFVLSMIETAIEVSDEHLPSSVIQEILPATLRELPEAVLWPPEARLLRPIERSSGGCPRFQRS